MPLALTMPVMSPTAKATGTYTFYSGQTKALLALCRTFIPTGILTTTSVEQLMKGKDTNIAIVGEGENNQSLEEDYTGGVGKKI